MILQSLMESEDKQLVNGFRKKELWSFGTIKLSVPLFGDEMKQTSHSASKSQTL